MKLEGKYTLRITGDTDALISAGARRRDVIGYILERLLTGEEAAVEELDYWHITISQEPDERASIVAYLREIAEGSADEDALKHAANSIESGLHLDDER
jgi:hypothetical protein